MAAMWPARRLPAIVFAVSALAAGASPQPPPISFPSRRSRTVSPGRRRRGRPARFPPEPTKPRSGGACGRLRRGNPALGETRALVIVSGGRIVLERYAAGFGSDMPLPSWSMAKSITHALVGAAVLQGLVDIDAPMGSPHWRRAIRAPRSPGGSGSTWSTASATTSSMRASRPGRRRQDAVRPGPARCRALRGVAAARLSARHPVELQQRRRDPGQRCAHPRRGTGAGVAGGPARPHARVDA